MPIFADDVQVIRVIIQEPHMPDFAHDVPVMYRNTKLWNITAGGQQRIWDRLPAEFTTAQVQLAVADLVNPADEKATARALTNKWENKGFIRRAEKGWRKVDENER